MLVGNVYQGSGIGIVSEYSVYIHRHIGIDSIYICCQYCLVGVRYIKCTLKGYR